MTDQIADLLIRVKNASMIKKLYFSLPYSKMKIAILDIMAKNGYVKKYDVEESEGRKMINITVAPDKIPSHIKQISKPGLRVYAKSSNIPRPLRGFGLVVISTPKGVISGKDAAKMGVGGEVICEIW